MISIRMAISGFLTILGVLCGMHGLFPSGRAAPIQPLPAPTPELMGQIPQRCALGLKSEQYGYVIMRAKELKEDAFAEAFDIFIEDLRKLEAEGDELADAVASYERNECDPHNAKASALERDVKSYEADCRGELPQAQFEACISRKAALEPLISAMQNSYLVLHAKELEFIRRWRDFDQRAAKARANAEQMLDFDNTEQVLKLYVWKLRKQRLAIGSPTSCESMAKIFETMGKRVKNQNLLIDYTARSLIEERQDLNFFTGDPRIKPLAGRTFDASGFRKQYYADITENQVRHVLGFIAAGYYQLKTPAQVMSYFMDRLFDTEEDYELAVEGAKLGVSLRIGTYNSANFGRAVRGRLCQ